MKNPYYYPNPPIHPKDFPPNMKALEEACSKVASAINALYLRLTDPWPRPLDHEKEDQARRDFACSVPEFEDQITILKGLLQGAEQEYNQMKKRFQQ